MDEYPIIAVDRREAELFEQLGSKEKFWLPARHGPRRLFKFSRAGHGEDWAEKVAAEIAEALGIPHASIELADCDGAAGTVSDDFVSRGAELIHGNEILGDVVDGYPARASEMFIREHSVEKVMEVLGDGSFEPPFGMDAMPGIADGADAFVGYLMLDALITNTDRHHQNWGAIRIPKPDKPRESRRALAPTYDHASSLGRELSDDDRLARLDGRDQNRTVQRYLDRAPSRFSANETNDTPISPISAFVMARGVRPIAGAAWLERMRTTDPAAFASSIERVPTARMSAAARRFALRMLELNRIALLGDTGLT